jgi:hypothetical protein
MTAAWAVPINKASSGRAVKVWTSSPKRNRSNRRNYSNFPPSSCNNHQAIYRFEM